MAISSSSLAWASMHAWISFSCEVLTACIILWLISWRATSLASKPSHKVYISISNSLISLLGDSFSLLIVLIDEVRPIVCLSCANWVDFEIDGFSFLQRDISWMSISVRLLS